LKRTASAEWKGNLKAGKGAISTASSVLDNTPYGYSSRFEGAKGTNPEELIAAAHAGCFSMALSVQLEQAGLTADSIRTTCTISFEQAHDGWTITASHLDVKAKVPGADREKFQQAADSAKQGCPVSKVLNAEISMNAELEG
jgi:osmotically inducible protein OsmC